MRRWILAGALLAVVGILTTAGADVTTEVEPDEAMDLPREEAEGYELPPERREQAIAYSRARYRLYFLGVGWEVAVLAGILLAGLGPALRDLAASVTQRPWAQGLLYVPPLFAFLVLLGLPLAAWGHSLAVRYDQSIQTWGSWLWDWTKGQLIGIAIATLLVSILYAILRRSPALWWLWFWLASVPIVVFLLYLQPLVIAPLFFRFTPLAESQPDLARRIGEIVDNAGLDIPRERIFEMNASEKLKAVNAYVAGIGGSKRVVVWDTTIQKMEPPQTLFIVGHEMGHYALNHIPRLIAVLSAGLLVLYFVAYRVLGWTIARFGETLSIHHAGDWASLPVLLLVFTVAGFFAAPLFNAYSRSLERQADAYGLRVIRGVVPDPGPTAARAFQRLGEIDLADPDPPPFIEVWLYSHPPLDERIRSARRWAQEAR